eukprot:scaffold15224_cov66-Phaeocystis_antarctica.AAC.2
MQAAEAKHPQAGSRQSLPDRRRPDRRPDRRCRPGRRRPRRTSSCVRCRRAAARRRRRGEAGCA